MTHTIFTILVGLATMILFVLAVGLFGWFLSELDKDPRPYWAQGFGAVIFVIVLLFLAYEVGKRVLGVL